MKWFEVVKFIEGHWVRIACFPKRKHAEEFIENKKEYATKIKTFYARSD